MMPSITGSRSGSAGSAGPSGRPSGSMAVVLVIAIIMLAITKSVHRGSASDGRRPSDRIVGPVEDPFAPGSSASVLVRGSGTHTRQLQDRPSSRGRIRPTWRALGVFAAVLAVATIVLTLPWASATGAWTHPL